MNDFHFTHLNSLVIIRNSTRITEIHFGGFTAEKLITTQTGILSLSYIFKFFKNSTNNSH